MANLRQEYAGRGELSERQQKLGQMMGGLRKLAEEFNIAVFVTNQANCFRNVCFLVYL